MENQEDKNRNESHGYTPEPGSSDNRSNNREEDLNPNWDQAQRRNQAGPRSYNESTDSENINNQNTEANREQIGDIDENDDPNDPKLIGDQISQRQQTIDEKDAPKDQNNDREKQD